MRIDLENYLYTFFRVKFKWGKLTGSFIPYGSEQLNNLSIHHKYDDVPSFSPDINKLIGEKPYILNKTVYLDFSSLSKSKKQSLD
jgi:hypothetical protein